MIRRPEILSVQDFNYEPELGFFNQIFFVDQKEGIAISFLKQSGMTRVDDSAFLKFFKQLDNLDTSSNESITLKLQFHNPQKLEEEKKTTIYVAIKSRADLRLFVEEKIIVYTARGFETLFNRIRQQLYLDRIVQQRNNEGLEEPNSTLQGESTERKL